MPLLHVQLQRGASQHRPPESFVRLTIIITVDSYVISQKHATCSSSWLSRSRSWHKVATCFLNFVDLRIFWIFCLALLCIFHEAVTPTNIGCCTHPGKQKRVAVKYVNFTPSFYQKIKRRFCAVKKQIGTFLPVFPCVTIHVRVVFPLLTVFHMCPYVSALRYDSKVNCDVYSSRILLNTIICARQLSLNILYAVAYTRSLNCFCIILYFPPIFLQSDNILCQRYTVFLVPLLLVDT